MKKSAKSDSKPKIISKKESSKKAENVLLDYVKLRKEVASMSLRLDEISALVDKLRGRMGI
jgi:transcriptional antiterminator Rof (Rho-off)